MPLIALLFFGEAAAAMTIGVWFGLADLTSRPGPTDDRMAGIFLMAPVVVGLAFLLSFSMDRRR